MIALIFLFFSIIGLFTIPPDWTDKEPLNWLAVKKFDVVGVVLTIFGIGMFSAAISLGETAPQGWKTGYVLALLIVGIFLMIVFVFWEQRYPYPLVPMSIWKDRNFSLVLAVLLLGFMSFMPASFFISLYFQDVWHMNALEVGVHLLPMAVCGLIANIFAGLVLHKVSNKLLMFIGAFSYFIAFTLLSVNTMSSSYWAFCFPSFCLVVIGADFEFNVANMYVMSSMPPSRQSIASGIFQTVAKLCTTIGYGIATALFNSVGQDPHLSSYWDKETQPYTATFWYAAACAGFSVCLVPFLSIGTQGGKEKTVDQHEDTKASPQSPKLCSREDLQEDLQDMDLNDASEKEKI